MKSSISGAVVLLVAIYFIMKPKQKGLLDTLLSDIPGSGLLTGA